jgi:hypothetical protein
MSALLEKITFPPALVHPLENSDFGEPGLIFEGDEDHGLAALGGRPLPGDDDSGDADAPAVGKQVELGAGQDAHSLQSVLGEGQWMVPHTYPHNRQLRSSLLALGERGKCGCGARAALRAWKRKLSIHLPGAIAAALRPRTWASPTRMAPSSTQ